jgi:hypothetical protein
MVKYLLADARGFSPSVLEGFSKLNLVSAVLFFIDIDFRYLLVPFITVETLAGDEDWEPEMPGKHSSKKSQSSDS